MLYKLNKIAMEMYKETFVHCNEKEGISEWFNYRGYTYIFNKIAK